MIVEAVKGSPALFQKPKYEIAFPLIELPRPLIEMIFKLLDTKEQAALRSCSNRFHQIGRDLIIRACMEEKEERYIPRYTQLVLAANLIESKLKNVRFIQADEISKSISDMQKVNQQLKSLIEEQSNKRQKTEVDHFLLYGY